MKTTHELLDDLIANGFSAIKNGTAMGGSKHGTMLTPAFLSVFQVPIMGNGRECGVENYYPYQIWSDTRSHPEKRFLYVHESISMEQFNQAFKEDA